MHLSPNSKLGYLYFKSDQTGKSFPDIPYTPAQLYDAVIVVVSQRPGRKCTVPAKS